MTSAPFSSRHLGLSEEDTKVALNAIGEDSIESLIAKTIPESIRLKQALQLEDAYSEYQYINRIKELAHQNKVFKSYIGLGYYNTKVPAVIQRNIFENPGWYTAYTPYQAEIAQGRLEALLNFQTMVTDLTGMDIANASLLDESTAVAEGMSLMFASRSRDMVKAGVNKFFVASDAFPQTIELLKTRTEPIGVELIIADPESYDFSDDIFGAFLQYPNVNGKVVDYSEFIKKAHDKGALVGVAADLMSLALLKPPGEWGADVVCGTTQRFGIPMGFGGPHAAYFATRDEFKRSVPGRIIGLSVDADGKPALRMALQTREQHIKRDRATSNICTAQVLLAVMAGMYAVYHGKDGIYKISRSIHAYTHQTATSLEDMGYEIKESQYFDTIWVGLGSAQADQLMQFAVNRGINLRKVDEYSITLSLNETIELEELNNLIQLFADFKGHDFEEIAEVTGDTPLQDSVVRTSSFLTHPVFNRYQTETELMRYIKRLENKDFSLVHGMIPLGSCTMKLNAASELTPLSWPEFANIHPFAPKDQVGGYYEMLHELERDLSEITGFHTVSLQPNSGAQGEYAGLMVIRAYHLSRGDDHRNIALIPSSAHGTNPASAVMAGMKVVVVKCDENGNIDLQDLEEKAVQHKDNLSALMITYPSTHGVFEEDVVKITEIVHENGGQVYMDGANMNAQVGLTNPANIGADVCHLNLHKTFAIPHGGGGPGMGPIGVAEHLAPFLPGNPIVETGGEQAITPISAAPFGSALVLIISHAYIKMLGEEGLRKSTETAILSANYIKKKLEGAYDILYHGKNNTVAHEMILDCRGFKAQGIEVVDIAKRLIDYGFHAPTVSFPVNNTLMVEPTESESLNELDRFIEAMLSIRKEIDEIAIGEFDKENNVLKNSPHTQFHLTSDDWNFPYSRRKAAFPVDGIQENKFWASVRRVDNAFGDRNLVCSCPPITEYEMTDMG